MASLLTADCLSAISNGTSIDNPVVQVLGSKTFALNNTERCRLLISDGKVTQAAMIGGPLNHYVTDGKLQDNTIITINRYLSNNLPNSTKKMLIIVELTILKSAAEVGGKIGNPVSINSLSTTNGKSNGAEKPQQGPSTPIGKNVPPSSTVSPSRNIHPISGLNPYQNRWTIRARVTSKSDIRRWSNSRGEGKLFNVDLLDDSAEIRATGFNEQCDQFYDLLEVNKVYYISKGTLKNANKAFTSIKNDYEISFHSGTEVTPCNEKTDLPVLQFEFVEINNLESMPKDSIVDVIGVCKSFGELKTIVTRTTGKEIQKRDIQLVDKSNTEITLTFWGEQAAKFDGSRNPVIATKGARLTEFNGRSLSVLYSSVVHIDPDIQEAFKLRGWYDSEGVNLTTQSISNKSGGMAGNTNWKLFWEVTEEGLGRGEKPDYYTTKATIISIKHETALYMACPSDECNKKVVDMNNGMYRCEKCMQEFSSFKWRLILQLQVSDFSGNKWVTAFEDSAVIILEKSAADLGELKEQSENNKNSDYISYMNQCCFKEFVFKLRTRLETYNNESRLKHIVMSVAPVNHAEYGSKLAADLMKLKV